MWWKVSTCSAPTKKYGFVNALTTAATHSSRRSRPERESLAMRMGSLSGKRRFGVTSNSLSDSFCCSSGVNSCLHLLTETRIELLHGCRC